MNKVMLIGRLTAKPELKNTNSNISFTRFTIAVNRKFTDENGERQADFINCLAWKKTAELICEHFNKGSELAVYGRIQTGSYDAQDGTKRYTTDVVVEEITFIGSKDKNNFDKKEENTITEEQQENDPFAEFGESVSIEDNFLD